ncbi:ATP-binding protein [Sphaerisporangium sp. NPDC051011]|uniref:ATP-binding protein n=1 Tax=Sphaerisporangium sp. NPDC051011 TaxID=3155792 RepID=UPI0033CDE828
MIPRQRPSEDQATRSHTFPGSTDQVREARRFARTHLPDHPDAELIASELATNAIAYTRTGAPGGTFTATILVRDDGTAYLEITDQGGPTTFGPRTSTCEGGRGLPLIAALITAWGIKGDHTGRTAELPPPSR